MATFSQTLAQRVSVLVNYIVAVTSIREFGFGHQGLALAASAVALSNFAVLFFFLRRRTGGLEDWDLAAAFVKTTSAAMLMA